jgi:hypothetical protein
MRLDVSRAGVVVLVLVVGGGCDVADDPGGAPIEIDGRSVVGNAQVLNSAVLNGVQFNGVQFNGVQFNGVQFNGVQFNGVQFNGVQFNGSSFTGTVDLGAGPEQKSGVQFTGAELKLTRGADHYSLRFDDIHENPAQAGRGVLFYSISWRNDAGGPWAPLCQDAAGAPVEAIPLANYWDMTTGARTDDANVVTFACRGAVLAKCVEWGYIPWASVSSCSGGSCTNTALRDHHQACTRMARADYCGNGRSYTFDGTPIDLYDRLNPRLQARTTQTIPDWKLEAEWGPNGATCVGDELRLKMFDDLGLSYTYPACLERHRRRQQLRHLRHLAPGLEARHRLLLQVAGRA